MSIRAVIFDLGGVLLEPSPPIGLGLWERRLGLRRGELSKTIFGRPAARRASVGEATAEQVWSEVAADLALPVNELKDLARDLWPEEWNTELLDFAHSLRPTYKTAVISNCWLNEHEFLREYTGNNTFEEYMGGSKFDLVVYSAEEGIRKPDPEIYRLALNRLGVAAEETVFVDDKPWNVASAKELGIHALLFTSTDAVVSKIERLLRT